MNSIIGLEILFITCRFKSPLFNRDANSSATYLRKILKNRIEEKSGVIADEIVGQFQRWKNSLVPVHILVKSKPADKGHFWYIFCGIDKLLQRLFVDIETDRVIRNVCIFRGFAEFGENYRFLVTFPWSEVSVLMFSKIRDIQFGKIDYFVTPYFRFAVFTFPRDRLVSESSNPASKEDVYTSAPR